MTAPADSVQPQFVELGQAPTLSRYLRDLWSRREFAVYVPYQDLRFQNMHTALGQFWHFLNPAFTVFVYYVIFGLVLEVDRGVSNYIGFLIIGVLLYTVTTRIAGDAVNTMERDAGLIRSVEFPRALLPISAVNGQTMAFVPALAILFGSLLLTGERPSVKWLLTPVVLLVHYMVNVGFALIFARLGFGVRDMSQLITHIFRLMFYASGVLFLPERFISNPTLLKLFDVNPLYGVLAFGRWVWLDDMAMRGTVVFFLVLWAVVLPVVGIVLFLRAEYRFGK